MAAVVILKDPWNVTWYSTETTTSGLLGKFLVLFNEQPD